MKLEKPPTLLFVQKTGRRFLDDNPWAGNFRCSGWWAKEVKREVWPIKWHGRGNWLQEYVDWAEKVLDSKSKITHEEAKLKYVEMYGSARSSETQRAK